MIDQGRVKNIWIYLYKSIALEQKYSRAIDHSRKNISIFPYFVLFFHPDYTVGLGISPNHTLRLVGYTTGRESHPALKILFSWFSYYNRSQINFQAISAGIRHNHRSKRREREYGTGMKFPDIPVIFPNVLLLRLPLLLG